MMMMIIEPPPEDDGEGDPPPDTCYTRLTYYVNDMYGSVRAGMSGSTVLTKLEYYPYGEVYSMSGGGSVYTFLGKEDPGVGLLDFGPRYYNGLTGRFLSPDPILAGASAYSYCAGNPIMLYDPSGMMGRHVRKMYDPVEEAMNRYYRYGNACEAMHVQKMYEWDKFMQTGVNPSRGIGNENLPGDIGAFHVPDVIYVMEDGNSIGLDFDDINRYVWSYQAVVSGSETCNISPEAKAQSLRHLYDVEYTVMPRTGGMPTGGSPGGSEGEGPFADEDLLPPGMVGVGVNLYNGSGFSLGSFRDPSGDWHLTGDIGIGFARGITTVKMRTSVRCLDSPVSIGLTAAGGVGFPATIKAGLPCEAGVGIDVMVGYRATIGVYGDLNVTDIWDLVSGIF